MRAKDLISDLIPSLKPHDSGAKALEWMDLYRVSHLPIVSEKEFIGLISDSDIYNLTDINSCIEDCKLSFPNTFAYASQHAFTLIEIASINNISVVPILEKTSENEADYIGCVTQSEIINYLNTTINGSMPGGIIELKIEYINYSASHISQIIEEADAKILSLFTNYIKEKDELSVFVKINKEDIREALNALERYGYNIASYYSRIETIDEQAQKNYDALLSYLNV